MAILTQNNRSSCMVHGYSSLTVIGQRLTPKNSCHKSGSLQSYHLTLLQTMPTSLSALGSTSTR